MRGEKLAAEERLRTRSRPQPGPLRLDFAARASLWYTKGPAVKSGEGPMGNVGLR